MDLHESKQTNCSTAPWGIISFVSVFPLRTDRFPAVTEALTRHGVPSGFRRRRQKQGPAGDHCGSQAEAEPEESKRAAAGPPVRFAGHDSPPASSAILRIRRFPRVPLRPPKPNAAIFAVRRANPGQTLSISRTRPRPLPPVPGKYRLPASSACLRYDRSRGRCI